MKHRKYISWKKKYACALLALGHVPYAHAREMSLDQMISLYHIDHNILHETEHKNVDQWWNLTPMLINAHRTKTKVDAKLIAKGRRIREKPLDKWLKKHPDSAGDGNHVARLRNAPLRIDPDEVDGENYRAPRIRPLSGSHNTIVKIRSRGFDKTLRKKLDGTVIKRERK